MSAGLRAVPVWVWVIAIVPLLTVGVGVASGLTVHGLRSFLAHDAAARAPEEATLAPSAASLPGASPLVGESADLSSIMGRARKLADGWEREAALLGIEAVLMQGQVRTEDGATAKLTFGPSTVSPVARPSGQVFVVVYDRSGLRGSPVAGSAGKTLPEPRCAPEHVLSQVEDLGAAPVSVRYGYDADERALWFTSPAQRPAELRVFDPGDCRPRGRVVVAPRPKR